MNTLWPWLTLAMLGAYHGLNPAMGWLFAVALGLQERRRAAVLRAFAPIALGHAVSVGLVVALVVVAQAFISLETLKLVGAGALVAFGIYKLLAPMSHPRWVGMRVGFRDLAAWSFLMATAHGAGLMLLPVALRLAGDTTAYAAVAHDHTTHDHATHAAQASYICGVALPAPLVEIGAVAVHTAAMFLVMAAIAVVVYEKVGLAILRRAWINLDLVWALALIASGVLSLVL
ncbi:MAG: hypothetical protein H7Y32_02545 [Chloroflexales bacterium]|nr:hypothetical protein [Chloroflexales bacterium]